MSEKRCTACGHLKPVAAFYRRNGHPRSTCKDCEHAASRVWRRTPSGVLAQQLRRIRRRLDLYGLTPERYQDLWDRQRGACGVCTQPFTSTPMIDHNHRTNRVRGLLCGTCNKGLGLFHDSATLLQAASNYIRERHVEE